MPGGDSKTEKPSKADPAKSKPLPIIPERVPVSRRTAVRKPSVPTVPRRTPRATSEPPGESPTRAEIKSAEIAEVVDDQESDEVKYEIPPSKPPSVERSEDLGSGVGEVEKVDPVKESIAGNPSVTPQQRFIRPSSGESGKPEEVLERGTRAPRQSIDTAYSPIEFDDRGMGAKLTQLAEENSAANAELARRKVEDLLVGEQLAGQAEMIGQLYDKVDSEKDLRVRAEEQLAEVLARLEAL